MLDIARRSKLPNPAGWLREPGHAESKTADRESGAVFILSTFFGLLQPSVPDAVARRVGSRGGISGRSGSEVPRGRQTMSALSRRLQRLEKRFALVVEAGSAEDSPAARIGARLEAARLRCGLPPPSPERLAELRGMSICQILNAARDRLALAAHSSARDLKCRTGERP
jgi:hypothetical protein